MRAPLLICCVALAGCVSQQSATPVDLSDGVDREEASVLARDYLREHMPASLGHTGPFDGGTAWVFKITGDAVPLQFADIPPVVVNKNTGVVTWDAKPPLKK